MSKSLGYHNIEELLAMIDEPYKARLKQILSDNNWRIKNSPGSTHNHQAWRGGYLDHVLEVMNLAVQLYRFITFTGRMSLLPAEEQFSLSDALVVLFLHDIEKAWRIQLDRDGFIETDQDGKFLIAPNMESKANRELFKKRLITEYEIGLSDAHWHALHFVEGIRDKDYSPGARTMSPLAVFCHTCDLWSARVFYEFPFSKNDPWSDIGRTFNPTPS